MMNLFETRSEITKVGSDLTTQMERSNFFGGDLTGGDMTMERSNRIPNGKFNPLHAILAIIPFICKLLLLCCSLESFYSITLYIR